MSKREDIALVVFDHELGVARLAQDREEFALRKSDQIRKQSDLEPRTDHGRMREDDPFALVQNREPFDDGGSQRARHFRIRRRGLERRSLEHAAQEFFCVKWPAIRKRRDFIDGERRDSASVFT